MLNVHWALVVIVNESSEKLVIQDANETCPNTFSLSWLVQLMLLHGQED